MAKKVQCSSCGVENELTAVFCRGCGAKMNLAAVQASDFSHGHGLSKETILRLVKYGVTLIVLLLLGLLAWPASTNGLPQPSRAASVQGLNKLKQLADGVKSGSEVEAEISELEVNSYLVRKLGAKKDDLSSGQQIFDSFQIDLTPGGVRVVLTKKLFGRVPITYQLKGVPEAGEGPFVFRLQGASVGHLPMIGPAAAWPKGQMEAVLSELKSERNLLNSADSLRLGNDSITLTTS